MLRSILAVLLATFAAAANAQAGVDTSEEAPAGALAAAEAPAVAGPEWQEAQLAEVVRLLPSPMPPGRVSADAARASDPRLRAPARRSTRFGLSIDGGFPDGAGVSLLYRPWFFLRLGAGGSYNLANAGVRAGVTLLPSPYFVTPTLTLEAGRMFAGDARRGIRRWTGELDPAADVLLTSVGYDYHTVALGLEVGSQRRAQFFLHAGVTYLSTTLNDFARAVEAQNPDMRVEATDPSVSFSAPSVKVGFNLYFW